MHKNWLTLLDSSSETGGGGATTTNPPVQVTPSHSSHQARARSGPPAPTEAELNTAMDMSSFPSETGIADQLITAEDSKGAVSKVSTTQEEVKPAVVPESKGVVAPSEVKVEDKTKKTNVLDVLKKPGAKKGEVAPAVTARDYSMFDPEEVEHAKKCSNETFTLLTKLKKLSKESTEGMFLQHPEAYVTHPKYKELQVDISFTRREAKHWFEQLENCNNGKPWKPLKSWDPQGNPIFGPEEPANAANSELLRRAYYDVAGQSQKMEGDLKNFSKEYKTIIDRDISAIDTECKSKFVWEGDPTMMESTLTYPEGEVPLKKIKQDFINFLPAYIRNQPSTRIAANLFLALQIQGKQMEQMQGQLSVKSTLEKEESLVEPGGRTRPAAKKGMLAGIPETFSTANMPE